MQNRLALIIFNSDIISSGPNETDKFFMNKSIIYIVNMHGMKQFHLNEQVVLKCSWRIAFQSTFLLALIMQIIC